MSVLLASGIFDTRKVTVPIKEGLFYSTKLHHGVAGMIKRPADEPLMQQPINSAFVVKTRHRHFSQIAIADENHRFMGVAYGNGRYVASGSFNFNDGTIGITAISDDDGYTWEINKHLEYIEITNIIFANNAFVAIAITKSNPHALIIRSLDNGITWEETYRHHTVAIGGINERIDGLIFANSMCLANIYRFVSGHTRVRELLLIGDDKGGAWNEQNVPNMVVLTGKGDGQIIGAIDTVVDNVNIPGMATSADGVSWKTVSTDMSIGNWFSDTHQRNRTLAKERIWNHTLHVLFGGSPLRTEMYRSMDNGETWNRRFTSSYNTVINEMIYLDDMIIGVGYGRAPNTVRNMIISYDNGLSWTFRILATPDTNYWDIAAGENGCVAIGNIASTDRRAVVLQIINEYV